MQLPCNWTSIKKEDLSKWFFIYIYILVSSAKSNLVLQSMILLFALLLLVFGLNNHVTTHPVSNKSVVSTGGPGTMVVIDMYNKDGNWKRSYHPTEPQQIHISWISEGKAFRVQFSTMKSIKQCQLHYWSLSTDEKVVINQSQVIKIRGYI